ncbi:hypothetical protein R69927_07347 [Paraburkholderia domus]|jgi:hypothetical protein|uniref:Uncharacterized protein n=1 Tax=Paraburkholderia domus TaxID=2793075 RepID=A0A9N8N2T3_9BURK|nr:hypothetical protein [Paraburkholderia domus]MBK5054604.1 hypothetical protein [Burkholderia sp. R-70006]MBK5066084.1 hypothetical protein [Burkholderia sp. R-70199]MBK5091760.1 hypothetical protein [Burkholderia sp. R-69927]MBK5118944.1 hypothetical protein [Burkholderia sp. R-69980]MBK5168107.1 hypothetical protein [Burkholderia sp. R-70211]MBK5186537.1 hypothetical protein [Burkholderia sp. R-69749]
MAYNEILELHPRDLRKRVYVVTILMILVGASAVVYEFLPQWIHSPQWLNSARGLANAFFAVFGSILAAALVPLSIHFYSDLVRKKTKAKFTGFFFLPPSRKAIIVLPRFKIENSTGVSQDTGVNSLCLKEVKELDRACVSIDDLVAARHISAMFAEHQMPVPRIFFDDDVWEVVFGKTNTDDDRHKEIRECKTFIVVGLFSNAISTELNKSLDADRSFRLSTLEDANKGDRHVEIAPMENTSPEQLRRWGAEESSVSSGAQRGSFGLIARLSLPGERVALLVGGGTARATRKMASHLRRHWLQLYDLREMERDVLMGTNSFSMEFAVSDVLGSRPVRGRAYYRSDAIETESHPVR